LILHVLTLVWHPCAGGEWGFACACMERVQELAGLFGTFLNADGAWRMSFHAPGKRLIC